MMPIPSADQQFHGGETALERTQRHAQLSARVLQKDWIKSQGSNIPVRGDGRVGVYWGETDTGTAVARADFDIA